MEELNNNRKPNGINIKFIYSINNTIKKTSIKLYLNENLENNFKIIQNDNEHLNQKNINEFHLLRDNKKILLDKNKKAKELNLKEGDLISVSFKNKITEIRNTEHSHNVSSANLNEEISQNQNSNTAKPFFTKKTKYVLLLILISFIFIITAFLVVYFSVFHKKKSNKNNNEMKDIIFDDTDKKTDSVIQDEDNSSISSI